MGAISYRVPQPDSPEDLMPAFTVSVFHDPEAKVWLAVSDEIPVATEADGLPELMERVWLIAPEMAIENHLRSRESDIRLDFVIHTRPA